MRRETSIGACVAMVAVVASCGGSGATSSGTTGGAGTGGKHETSSASGTMSSGHGGVSSSSSTGHGGVSSSSSGQAGASSSGSGTTSSGPGGASSSTGGASSSTGGAGTSSGQSSSTGGQGSAATGSSVSATASGSGGSPSDGGTCPAFKSCADQGFDCGMAMDGCGNAIDCGTCPAGQVCGAVTANVCGIACTPKSCADQGFDCGMAMDGCGNTINCGICPVGETCGGTAPNVCACVGLCQQQQTCPGGGTTSVSGTVYAPNTIDPLPGVTVYVPNGGPAPTYGVQPFAPGVSCQSCSAMISGSPLVSTTTAADGTFSLTNMPVGTNIPLVIQKGRWRRQFVIPSVVACTNTALPTTGANQIRMPRTKAEGDIPLMAFVTGGVDVLECLLLKIGIPSTEFSDPSGTGRVRFYLGSGGPGARYTSNTPGETTLWGMQAAINQYDMVFFACQANQYNKTAAQQQVLINYANAGGRVFATHYEYVWLYNVAPFSGTATWSVNQTTTFASDPGTGLINTSFARSNLLAQWLQAIGATTTLGQVPVGTLRHDFNGVVAPSLLWLSVNDATAGNVPLHFTFDTPVGATPSSQCGRVLFTDFHAESYTNGTSQGLTFPSECVTSGMTPQEKMVEYMLFDLDDCIAP